jgi:amino acid permease
VVLLVLVGALSAFCMLLLVDCKYQLQRRGVAASTYGDIGRHALGAGGQRLVEVALVLAQAGFGVGCASTLGINSPLLDVHD